MEQGFLNRVYRASAVMAALIGVYGWAYSSGLWALTFVVAALWSVANLWVLEHLLRAWFEKKNVRSFGVFFCLKVLILCGLIVLCFITVPKWPFALISGVVLPYTVIVLKTGGHAVLQAIDRDRISRAATAEKRQDETRKR